MKLLIVAQINSIHTIRWINSLINFVDELHIASMHEPLESIDDRIVIHKLPRKAPMGYFTNHKSLKNIILKIKPDLIHTHYMSGYGTLSALAVNRQLHPHLLSMWGSDIYDFPEKSFVHKRIIRWVADKATILASTSHVMKSQFYKVYPNYPNRIEVTPFGVDTELFKPNRLLGNTDVFNIGIAKNIEDKYGINFLIEGFASFNKDYPNSKLHIIGQGSKTESLIKQVQDLELKEKVVFYGRINNKDLPKYINSWNVCVFPSILESFGVSAVETCSCALPVIVSNVGGLPEVVEDGVTGIIIPPKNPEAIYRELTRLFLNPELCLNMGLKGRERVLNKYDWNENVKQMVLIYKKMLVENGN
ncbi:glycosyltransferase [Maribacter sp. Asnod2-G09]|uniref:glycosyltransferase n=1 Tax=Maribacter sp. Asnod2-G09 TaxID=3160577 RepID=UPI00386E620F